MLPYFSVNDYFCRLQEEGGSDGHQHGTEKEYLLRTLLPDGRAEGGTNDPVEQRCERQEGERRSVGRSKQSPALFVGRESLQQGLQGNDVEARRHARSEDAACNWT